MKPTRFAIMMILTWKTEYKIKIISRLMMETDKHDFNLIVITNILKRNNAISKSQQSWKNELMKPSN